MVSRASNPFLLLGLLLAGVASAQSTWVVDAAGGTGVQFTDIPPAIAAAASGDIILVNGSPTKYSLPATITKGLRIVGVQKAIGQAWYTPSIAWSGPGYTISKLGSGQAFTLSWFNFDIGTALVFQQCGGPIVLDHCGQPGGGFSLVLLSCPSVGLHDCTIEGGRGASLWSAGSSYSASRCTIRGSDGYVLLGSILMYATVGLTDYMSRIVLSDTSVLGGRAYGSPQLAPTPAMGLSGGTQLGIARGCWVLGGGAVAIAGDATTRVELDPATTLAGTVQAGVIASVPLAAQTLDSSVGSVGTAVVGLRPGEIAAVCLGIPATPAIQTPIGTLWIEPTSLVALGTGTASSSGAVGFTVALPKVPQWLGLPIATQSVIANPTLATLTLCAPAFGVVR